MRARKEIFSTLPATCSLLFAVAETHLVILSDLKPCLPHRWIAYATLRGLVAGEGKVRGGRKPRLQLASLYSVSYRKSIKKEKEREGASTRRRHGTQAQLPGLKSIRDRTRSSPLSFLFRFVTLSRVTRPRVRRSRVDGCSQG